MKPKLTKEALTNIEILVLEHLKIGHKNATSLRELVNRTSINERKLRMAIESLRLQGYDVIFFSDAPMGYGFSETEQDVSNFIDYMRSRIINECRIMRALKTARFNKYHKTVGQLKLMI